MTGIFDRRNLKRILTGFVTILGLLFFGWLLWYNFRYTYYFVPEYYELFTVAKDSMTLHLLIFILCIAAVYGMTRFSRKIPQGKKERMTKCLLLFTMFAVTVMGIVWINIVHAKPCADQMYVMESAFSLMDGDYEVLRPDRYLGQIPYQLGLAVLFRFLFTLFQTRNYQLIQYCNAACLPVIVFAGYQILKNIGGKLKAGVLYCILTLCCFPLLFYTPFVYGEIFSVTAGMLLVWGGIACIRSGKKKLFMPVICCGILGVVTRGNFWVVIAAAAMVLGLYGLKRKDWVWVLLTVCFAAAPLLFNKGLTVSYEQRSGIKLDQGIPLISNVAMGIHDEGSQPSGWNNLHNYYAYAAGGNNKKAAAEISKDYIKQRIKSFQEGNADWKPYLKEKLLTQWEEPTFQSLLCNHDFEEEPIGFVYDIYYGKLKNGLLCFLNEYQWLVYLGTVLSFWYVWRAGKPFYMLLPEMILIGGFLFSIIWEAKTRYCFPYLIYMLPCAAAGLTLVSEKAGKRK